MEFRSLIVLKVSLGGSGTLRSLILILDLVGPNEPGGGEVLRAPSG
jgi:hypothetical protein